MFKIIFTLALLLGGGAVLYAGSALAWLLSESEHKENNSNEKNQQTKID
jgi:hypothetical protein